MARRKNNIHNGPGLFEEREQQQERRIRRQRALFMHRIVISRGDGDPDHV